MRGVCEKFIKILWNTTVQELRSYHHAAMVNLYIRRHTKYWLRAEEEILMTTRKPIARGLQSLLLVTGLSCFMLTQSVKVLADPACTREIRQKSEQNVVLSLVVREFEAGKYDLAMLLGEQAPEVKRISFSGRESACAYQPLVLERGGSWGWHMVWQEPDRGLFYARMDGEAWVSSPSKRIADKPVQQVEFLSNGQQLDISWQDETGQQFSRRSTDEGRSWD